MSRLALLFGLACAVALSSCAGSPEVVGPPAPGLASGERPARLLIRSDDMGFSHGANVANRRLLETGLPVNVSVLFAAPWYPEAVAILKAHPEASVGVHLCANSEWRQLRWGPVSDASSVPSLVDGAGHFWGSYRALNLDRSPRTEDLEREFRAQIDRALATGLRIDYLDNHMGAGLATPDQRAMMARLSEDYGLPLSGTMGEARPEGLGVGTLPTLSRGLRGRLRAMAPDSLYLLVFHVATDTPELRALEDLNEGGVAEMSRQRQAELDLLTHPDLRAWLARAGVVPVTYRALEAGR